jgi:hypothetical protein
MRNVLLRVFGVMALAILALGTGGGSVAYGRAGGSHPMTPPPLHVSTTGHASRAGVSTSVTGSMVYWKAGDIWGAAADGSNAHQLTTGGGFLWTSQADDGTVVASGPGEVAPDGSTGSDIYVMDATGHLDHRITTPSDYSTSSWPALAPNSVRISPDATKIAYWNWEGGEPLTLWTPTSSTGLNWPNQTLGQENNENPAWIDNGHLLMDDPTAWGCFFGNPPTTIIRTYVVGKGDNTNKNWFDDTAEEGTSCYPHDGWASGYSATMTRSLEKLAILDDNASLQGGTPTKVAIRLFTTAAGSTTTAPTFNCQINLSAANYNPNNYWVGYASPTFSADGSELAWGDSAGVHVANVSNLSSCSSITQGLLIPGAALPYFSAANPNSTPPATIALSAGSGAPGVSVTVSGAAFGPNEKVRLTFTDSARAKFALGSVTTDGSGAFSKSVTIPAGAAAGKGKVSAKGVTSGLKAAKAFTIT